MAHLIIESEEAYNLARELAEEHQTSITTEVLAALRARAALKQPETSPTPNPKSGLAERLKALSETTAPRFKGEDRTRDLFEDLYDEDGLPR
jgi:hypothetical protein